MNTKMQINQTNKYIVYEKLLRIEEISAKICLYSEIPAIVFLHKKALPTRELGSYSSNKKGVIYSVNISIDTCIISNSHLLVNKNQTLANTFLQKIFYKITNLNS